MMAIGQSATTEEIKPCDWIATEDTRVIYSHIKSIIRPDSTILSLMKETLKNDKSISFCYDSVF